MDFAGVVIDEISLEGLDGITLSALWQRLELTRPAFPLTLDTDSKSYLWEAVIRPHPGLQFFKLEEPRPPLIIYNRYANIDRDTEMVQEVANPYSDLYPYHLVRDGKVVGSCASYYTRDDITSDIRPEEDPGVSLFDVINVYGESLVIVASPELRRRAIYPPNMDSELPNNDKIYCLLERIARARYLGEITNGMNSLKVWMTQCSKTLFYMRRKLHLIGLVTNQLFTMRSTKGNVCTGKVVHAKRFFVEMKSITSLQMERMTRKLAAKPKQMEVISILRGELGMKESSFKKLYQWGTKYVRPEVVSTREIFPDADEHLHYFKNNIERTVRVLKLLKLYTYSPMGGDDDDEETGCADDDDDDDGPVDPANLCPLSAELPLMRQVFTSIQKAGERGMNQSEVAAAFGFTRLDARMVCRNLERCEAVYKQMHDVGKQREQRFVDRHLIHQSSHHKALLEERRKILDHTKAVQEIKLEQEEAGLEPGPTQPFSHDPVITAKLDQSITKSMLSMDDEGNYDHRAKTNNQVTFRLLKRANMVLEAVKQAKVIDNTLYLQKKIIQEESKNELTGKMDKKSLLRLINKLEKDEQIKVFKNTRMIQGRERTLTLICDTSMTPDHPLVKQSIESGFNRMVALKAPEDSVDEPNFFPQDHVTMPNYALLKSKLKTADMVFDLECGRRYGYLPRMKRMQVIHEFLWYLVYGYGHNMNTPGGDCVLQENPADLSQEELLEADALNVPVYIHEFNWRRFIPKLPEHKDYGKGWFLVGDIILAMPIAFFFMIHRFNFKLKEIDEYLNHPVKRWIPVYKLPPALCECLMYERKYIHGIFEHFVQMNHMGLLSFGKREYKEKEQIYMYVHRNISIIDTSLTTMPTGEEALKNYFLESANDIHEYWFSLQWICLNTTIQKAPPAKKRNVAAFERFAEVARGKPPEEVIDNGSIPGDHKGAGGLDSYFFSHLKRNWNPHSVNYDFARHLDGPKSTPQVFINRLVQSQNKEVGDDPDDPIVIKTPPPKKRKRNRGKKETKTSPMEDQAHSPLNVSTNADGTEFIDLVDTTTDAWNGESSVVDDSGVINIYPKIEAPPKKSGPSKAKKAEKKEKFLSEPLPPLETMRVTGVRPKKGGKGIKRKKKEKQPGRSKKVLKKKEGPVAKTLKLDDCDREALGRMTKERSNWSAREDSLLLLWKVTLTFLGGWRRDSIVPVRVMRDYLHKTLPESRNKTAVACQRRLMNMLKNKDTEQNVRMYVGEALQDEDLIRDFLDGKTYKKIQAEKDMLSGTAVELFEKLVQKFVNSDSRPPIVLPDNITELNRKYVVHTGNPPTHTVHRDPVSKANIEFGVLHSLIHCAILLDDKTTRAHELFHVFSQYPEDLVNSAFISMKNDRIVTKIKKSDGYRFIKKSRLHMVSAVNMGTHQLSQRYTYFWLTKYPRTIFRHSHEVYQPLTSLKKTVPLEEPGKKMWLHVEGIAGSAAVVVALMPARKLVFETTVPEDIVVLDVRKPLPPRPRREEPTVSDEEEEARIDEAERIRAMQRDKYSHGSSVTEQDQSEPSTSKAGDGAGNQVTNPHAAQSTSSTTQAQTGTNDQATIAIMPASTETDDMSILSIPKPTISRTALSLTHNSQYQHAPGIRGEPLENLVVNSCTVRIRLAGTFDPPPEQTWDLDFEARESIKEWNNSHSNIHPRTGFYILKQLRMLQPTHIDLDTVLADCLRLSQCTEAEAEVMTSIYTKVKARGLFGITLFQLKMNFKEDPLYARCLELLREKHVVLRVGITMFRFVAHDHVRPWLIYSYKNVKGRGVFTAPEETNDVTEAFRLKDFPGAPLVIAEDYAIAPGEPQWSSTNDGKDSVIMSEQERAVLLTKRKTEDTGEMDRETNKRVRIDESSQPQLFSRDLTTSANETSSQMMDPTYPQYPYGHSTPATPVLDLDNLSGLQHTSLLSSLPENPMYNPKTMDPGFAPQGEEAFYRNQSNSWSQGSSGFAMESSEGPMGLLAVQTTSFTPPSKKYRHYSNDSHFQTGYDMQTTSFTPLNSSSFNPTPTRRFNVTLPDDMAAKEIDIPRMMTQGDIPRMMTHGDVPQMMTHSDNPGMMTHGDNPQMMTHGNIPQMMTQGDIPRMMTHGDNPRMMTHGDNPRMMTHGDVPQMMTHGDNPRMMTHGDNPQMMTHGDIPRMMTQGHIPQMMTHSDEYLPPAYQMQPGTQVRSTPAQFTGKPHLSQISPVFTSPSTQRSYTDLTGTNNKLPQLDGTEDEKPKLKPKGKKGKSSSKQPAKGKSTKKGKKSKEKQTEDVTVDESSNSATTTMHTDTLKSSEPDADIVEPPGEQVEPPGEQQGDDGEDSGDKRKGSGFYTLRSPKANLFTKSMGNSLPASVPPAKGTYQAVRLVCRPWKTPEGTVNRPILQMMLEGIMSYVMLKPGATSQTVVDKYSPILQPVALFELIEMLEIIGCIQKSFLRAQSRPSLFSTRCHYKEAGGDSGRELEMYYPTEDCVLKLGQFLGQIIHSYKIPAALSKHMTTVNT